MSVAMEMLVRCQHRALMLTSRRGAAAGWHTCANTCYVNNYTRCTNITKFQTNISIKCGADRWAESQLLRSHRTLYTSNVNSKHQCSEYMRQHNHWPCHMAWEVGIHRTLYTPRRCYTTTADHKAGEVGIHQTFYTPRRCYTTAADLSIRDERVQKYLTQLLERLIRLQAALVGGKMADRDATQAEIVRLKPIVAALESYNQMEQDLSELRQIGDGMSEEDRAEMEAMTHEETTRITSEMTKLGDNMMALLVPQERADHNDIILEVSAGVGGGEAFLFTREIFEMYVRHTQYRGWRCEMLEADAHDGGGMRKGSIGISGHDVYRNLKYESGVHRVQRVPKTEKMGRVHTSTVTVAIMPQPTDIDIEVNPKDLKIDTFRSSGAGGQHVNTTDSAVRIKHLPTGIVVECQTDRSQIKNRSQALKILRSRMYERELSAQVEENSRNRRIQVGSAGRSEKIRTYNFKQDRITDHRLGLNVHNMEDFLSGGDALADVINSLQRAARDERLLELILDKKS